MKELVIFIHNQILSEIFLICNYCLKSRIPADQQAVRYSDPPAGVNKCAYSFLCSYACFKPDQVVCTASAGLNALSCCHLTG